MLNCEFGGSGYGGIQVRRFIDTFLSLATSLVDVDDDVVVRIGGGIGEPSLRLDKTLGQILKKWHNSYRLLAETDRVPNDSMVYQ